MEKHNYSSSTEMDHDPATLQIATPLLTLVVLVCNVLFCGTTALAQFGFGEPEPIVARSAQEAKWDTILQRPHPELENHERTVGDLIKRLRQIGLPINLHQSAIDDACTEDELITLDLPSLPLLVRLQTALGKSNATLSVSRGSISIVSLSNVWDPELLGLRVYDVAHCSFQPVKFEKLIPKLFSEENWSQVEVIAKQLPPPNDHLIAVRAPYSVHVEVARFLEDVHKKGISTLALNPLNADSRPVPLGSDAGDSRFGSKPVRLPDKEIKPEGHEREGGGGMF